MLYGNNKTRFFKWRIFRVIAGLSPIEILEAKSHYDSNYYPPALTGLRGSHIGSFENAHKLGWEKKSLILIIFL